MLPFGTVTQTVLSTIDVDDRQVRVSLHIIHDGVEFVGRLWFAESTWTNSGKRGFTSLASASLNVVLPAPERPVIQITTASKYRRHGQGANAQTLSPA